MKKNIKVYIALGASLVGINAFGAQMFWGNADSPLVDRFNNQILATSGWLVQMYSAGADFTIDAFLPGSTTPADDDAILAYSHNWNSGSDANGYFFHDIATLAPTPGSRIYTVLFNAATIGAATHYAVVDAAAFNVQSYGNPEVPQDYNPGNVAAGDWVAVPEPSTYAFMGLGAVLLAIRRFRRS